MSFGKGTGMEMAWNERERDEAHARRLFFYVRIYYVVGKSA